MVISAVPITDNITVKNKGAKYNRVTFIIITSKLPIKRIKLQPLNHIFSQNFNKNLIKFLIKKWKYKIKYCIISTDDPIAQLDRVTPS